MRTTLHTRLLEATGPRTLSPAKPHHVPPTAGHDQVRVCVCMLCVCGDLVLEQVCQVYMHVHVCTSMCM
jgi:hypothetical protein